MLRSASVCTRLVLASATRPYATKGRHVDWAQDRVQEEYHSSANQQAPYGLRKATKIPVGLTGFEIVKDPLYNKGTAFEHAERDRLGIRGMLPSRYIPMNVQVKRVLRALAARKTSIDKYLLLRDLMDRNETLFHRVLVENIEDLAPIIYTPTVGEACQKFAVQYRRPRGMYFTSYDQGHMQAMVHNWPGEEVKIVVVTDGSRILGLGDLGANGMGISIGKLALYCAAGGIAPHHVMPVVLDCGTNNPRLLESEYYMGIQTERLTGEAYYAVVEEFVRAIYNRWPKCLIQFEDFSSDHALILLNKYRNKFLCFNDDIQGTGAICLSGIMSATRLQGKSPEDIMDHTILCAGAGSAGCGVVNALRDGMVAMSKGKLSVEEANARIFVCDQNGLLAEDRCSPEDWATMAPEQQGLAQRKGSGFTKGMTMLEVAQKVKPTIILGLSAVGGLFKEEFIREVAQHHERPIIFALSNPTTSTEVTAEDAYKWTDGKAIYASGSPFPEMTLNGRTFTPSQCNNMFIFPGLGLGASICGAKRVTDGMLQAAAVACSECLNEEEMASGRVFPKVNRIREVSKHVAVGVIKQALREGVAMGLSEEDELDLEAFVEHKMYYPSYVPLISQTH